MILIRLACSTMTQGFVDGDFTHLPSEKAEIPLIETLPVEGVA